MRDSERWKVLMATHPGAWTASAFHEEILKLEHPGWTAEDLKQYLAWERGNKATVFDRVKRLWRICRRTR